MDGNGCSIGTHILSYKPKQELSHRNCVERFLAASLLAREEPDQDDHEDYGDNADDGAGEFDA